MINYNYKDWKYFKKEYSLRNRQIAEIIGLKENSVKCQCTPKKPLPTWAKAFIYSWKNNKLNNNN